MNSNNYLKTVMSICLFIFLGSNSIAQYFPSKALGPLFMKIQMDTSVLSHDNKLFVDCIPKRDIDKIIKEYEKLDKRDADRLNKFVKDNFIIPSNSKESVYATDTSLTIREHLDTLWNVLTRVEGEKNKNSSLISLPQQYIVPGGRFREIYYWDSYFTMLGLEVSGKKELVFNMIDNFKFLIDSLGFIPNGNRTYYLSRSQPPFFSLMVGIKAEIIGEEAYKEYLPQLLKEYEFWMDSNPKTLKENDSHKHVVKLANNVLLNRYWDDLPEPRPESYREDLLEYQKSDADSISFFSNIRAACESGWDFSSRWLKDGINLHSINTTEIIPVDLNCLLFNLEKSIALGYKMAKNKLESEKFEKLAEKRKNAIIKYCWNENYDFYTDYNFVSKEKISNLSLAGMYPLFFRIASKQQALKTAVKIKKHFLYAGGLTSTLNLTGQQWDLPNGWAPLQYISIEGLYNYNINDLANDIKNRWLKCNKEVFLRTGKMMEKYDVINPYKKAGGGEYKTQDGFGWTNGVYLKLLEFN